MSEGEGGLRIARDRLIFMGLAVLDQIAAQCHREPHRRSVALRVTMAMLYAFSDGRRAPYDQFWRICAIPNAASDPPRSALRRGRAVQEAFHAICGTLGVHETGRFRADLRDALTEPGNAMRHYRAPLGPASEEDLARRHMADLGRNAAYARDAELARERRGKDCPLRG